MYNENLDKILQDKARLIWRIESMKEYLARRVDKISGNSRYKKKLHQIIEKRFIYLFQFVNKNIPYKYLENLELMELVYKNLVVYVMNSIGYDLYAVWRKQIIFINQIPMTHHIKEKLITGEFYFEIFLRELIKKIDKTVSTTEISKFIKDHYEENEDTYKLLFPGKNNKKKIVEYLLLKTNKFDLLETIYQSFRN